MMTVAVIGTGFVGVVTAAVYASLGHTVWGVDIDQKKIESLKQSIVPFYEPGLEELLKEQQATGKLFFTTQYKEAIPDADIVVIAVGTPSAADGSADLQYVFAASESVAEHLKENAVVVVKSTVPPGTLTQVSAAITKKTHKPFHIASVPEFLKEGTAVRDTIHPDRIVIGVSDDFAFTQLESLHAPLGAPILRMSPESAQMAKYGANAYLALRITYANQLADLCQHNGADIQEVLYGMGADARIGSHYWYPGFGYGGSCFPKDVKELYHYAKSVGEENTVFGHMHEYNTVRVAQLLEYYEKQIGTWQGKTVAVLGLSFKPHTDDLREAPSLYVIPQLLKKGARVVGYDPKALSEAKKWLPQELEYSDTIDAAVKQADVVIALIEWPEITSFEYGTAAHGTAPRWFIDARNQFDKNTVQSWGYTYLGVGR